MEMQISNMSIVDSHRPDPPANTNTTVPLSSTPRAPRRVSTDGNGVSLLRRSNNSSSADSDMIRRRMITEEEWNGAPHAHQKTTDDPNNLGRYKLAARRRRKIKGLVVAERGVIERQISNRSVVNVQRRSTYPPANTNTTVPLSSTPRAPRRVSTDGNGVSLLRRSNNSSSADSDMIRRRMITEEEWNGAPHAHQKTTDDPNNLGRYKLAARRRRKINGLKRVA